MAIDFSQFRTIAAVDSLYPGAAGTQWKVQVATDISVGRGPQAESMRSLEGYLLKSADSLDYTRVGPLDGDHFPFLRKPLATADGVIIAADPALRRQLTKEAEFLTKLTDPRTALMADFDKAQKECFELPDGPQHDLAEQECERLREEMRRLEAEQTENMSDEQIVEMVEKAIHDHPKELPLLTKYYK